MSDVKTFIQSVGADVASVTAPRIDTLAAGVNAAVLNAYLPRISDFANQLVKDIVDEQSIAVRDLVTALIVELSHRYHPELVGEVRARIVQHGVEVNGRGVRLNLKRQDTGAVIAFLDIPIALTISVDDLAVTFQDATIKLDVVK
jgi:hypothetical protein